MVVLGEECGSDASVSLHVPQLISALSYHFSRKYSWNLYSVTYKDDLMKACKDVAFIHLLNLAPTDARKGAIGGELQRTLRLPTNCKGEGRCSSLSHDGRHGVWDDLEGGKSGHHEWKHEDSLKELLYRTTEEGRTECPLLMPDGFVQDGYEPHFEFTEVDGLYRFLTALKKSGESEEEDVQRGKDLGKLDHKGGRDLKRPDFLEDDIDTDLLFVGFDSCSRGRDNGISRVRNNISMCSSSMDPNVIQPAEGMEGPRKHGWLLGAKAGQIEYQLVGKRKEDDAREVSTIFHHEKSASPIKVSLGALFADSSPGKMTSFDRWDLEGTASAGEDNMTMLPPDGNLYDDKKGIEVNNNMPHRLSRYSESLWGGEESELARDAMLALYGVKAALYKLRGRLIMPRALFRPASAKLLIEMERAASSRLRIQDLINRLLSQDGNSGVDSVLVAIGHGLHAFCLDLDEILLHVHQKYSNNWIENLGILPEPKRERASRVSLFRMEHVMTRAEVEGSEYHGVGISILHLYRYTASLRSKLVFLDDLLASALHTLVKEDNGIPSGMAMLDFIYEKIENSDGGNRELMQNLLRVGLVPYISSACKWAFSTWKFQPGEPFSEVLQQQYHLIPKSRIRRRRRQLENDTYGPSEGPSFLPADIQDAVYVAGAQLRLLQSAEDVKGVPELMNQIFALNNLTLNADCDHLGNADSNNHEPWFFVPDCDRIQGDSPGSTAISTSPGDGRILVSKLTDNYKKGASRLRDLETRMSSTLISRRQILEDILFDSVSSEASSDSVPLFVPNPIFVQADIVSRSCVSLFIDHLKLLDVLKFMRRVFLSFSGDFQTEFTREVDASVMALEPLTLHKVVGILEDAKLNSTIGTDFLSGSLSVDLLPGENAVSLLHAGYLSCLEEFGEIYRIKYPMYSAMAPMVTPPSGFDSLDCIFLSFKPSWPLGSVITEDTLTCYAAMFNLGVRVRKVEQALNFLLRFFSFRPAIDTSVLYNGRNFADIQRARSLRSFLFIASKHFKALHSFYNLCCSNKEWEQIQTSLDPLTAGPQRPKSLLDIVEMHRDYVYNASFRMISCCGSQEMQRSTEIMMSCILEIRMYLEGKLRADKRIEDIVHDNDTWKYVREIIKKYKDALASLRCAHIDISNSDSEILIRIFLETACV